jgi:probable rRNA maturation factor
MIEVEVEVEDAAWSASIADVEAVATRAAKAALGLATGAVTVLLSDDETVRELNARFRGKDRPTNVLSFPAGAIPGADIQPLGDIVLGFGVCADEARAQGKSLSDHLAHLTVHGVLHLLGRDHEDDVEAEAMEAEEREILATLGVADPYRVTT